MDRPSIASFEEPLTLATVADDVLLDITAGKYRVQQNAPYRVLGWSADRTQLYYHHRQTGQIACVKPAANASTLLPLADHAFWCARFPKGKEGNTPDWSLACSEVIDQANQAGVFAPEKVRGRGVWTDDGKTVWHLGNQLEVDGVITPLANANTLHQYTRMPPLAIDPSIEPLPDWLGQQIFDVISAIGWASPLDPIHLLGWIATANVGGALPKRPALTLTSRFASGKTWTIETVVSPLLAGLAFYTSNSTAAGVRQSLGCDTLPVLLDESEGEDPRRRRDHLNLARLSYDGNATTRGTSSGNSLNYAVRSSMLLAGINAVIANAADASRHVVVGRTHIPAEKWAEVTAKVDQIITEQNGQQLLRRLVTHLPVLAANTRAFRHAVELQGLDGAAGRHADLFAPLLAGAHLVLSTARLDHKQALAWLNEQGWSLAQAMGEEAEAQAEEAEAVQCLEHLLSHKISWRSDDSGEGRLTISELIFMARKPDALQSTVDAKAALARYGIRADSDGLAVATNPSLVAGIYSAGQKGDDCRWASGAHSKRLRELDGAFASGTSRRFGTRVGKAVIVPWAHKTLANE